MSELDDAIREHLELKRRHGARDAELKELEDEAFGTGERPLDPFKAAAETQVKGSEEGEGPPAGPETVSEPPPELTDLEAEAETSIAEPTLDAPPTEEPADEEPAGPPPPSPDMPIPPPPPQPDRAGEIVHQPTEEHPPPEPPSEEIAESSPAAEPPPEESPPDEGPTGDAGSMLYDFESDKPRPPLEPPPAEISEDLEERPPLPDPDSDDAFSDLGPAESRQGEGELPFEDDELPPEEALSHDADFEGEEGPGAVTADTSEREALDPTEQYTVPAEEPAPQFEDDDEEEAAPATGEEPEDDGEDVLEEKPDFLEETPEGEDDLWFEKKPPKDFDFDDE